MTGLLPAVHRDDGRHELPADLAAGVGGGVQVQVPAAREHGVLIGLEVGDRARHRRRGDREPDLHARGRALERVAVEVPGRGRPGEPLVEEVVADLVQGRVHGGRRPALTGARVRASLLRRVEQRVEWHNLPADLTAAIVRGVDVGVGIAGEDVGLVRLGVVPHAHLGIPERQREHHATRDAGAHEAVDVGRGFGAREPGVGDPKRHRVRVGVDHEPAGPERTRRDGRSLLPRVQDAGVNMDCGVRRRDRERGERRQRQCQEGDGVTARGHGKPPASGRGPGARMGERRPVARVSGEDRAGWGENFEQGPTASISLKLRRFGVERKPRSRSPVNCGSPAG